MEGALDEIIARVAGYEAGDIEHIWQLVWRLGFYRGGPDLKGRVLGVPVYQLLGGKVRQKVLVYAWIGGDWPSDVESPSAIDSCVERLKQVKALGVDAGLDFHGRLHKPMAKQLAKALEPYRPIFIEEPLLCKHPEALKQLSDLTAIPIAFGERLCEALDIAHARGISETVRIASMAETYDVAVAPHCPLGPIALAASIQVAFRSGGLKSVFDINEGYVKAPSGAGLGIEIDEALVRRISAKREPWLPKEFYGPDGGIREW
ncbi:enolase C-terminal domain-like protein [Aspergillus alliaceus]|uniref:enolase C-terminal domain-like protein n=1 Tax=Petromyces alliaceus TaxID=209559 RepID=UPI0012A4A10B|nr:enolase C-terminal domain-like protein [Aspergillus alliaceus]KAB8235211.1 enolase C-terminal domain-like protein [Aspergillus alliaceus]